MEGCLWFWRVSGGWIGVFFFCSLLYPGDALGMAILEFDWTRIYI